MNWKAGAGGFLVLAGVVGIIAHFAQAQTSCPDGFAQEGFRCRVRTGCPSPLTLTDHGCDEADRDVVVIPALSVVVGPSDWEAEGRVKPRTVNVEMFAIDRLEVSAGRFCHWRKNACDDDVARAANEVSLADARAYCIDRRGRLPTADEWFAAAAGDKPRRYPWGDTGAVCRRGLWGIEHGPCANGGNGPDTVGAHPDGATPLGIHDLAGNVAEWVESTPPSVRGGSWKTTLATELRTWPKAEVSAEVIAHGDVTTGFRCAYSAVR